MNKIYFICLLLIIFSFNLKINAQSSRVLITWEVYKVDYADAHQKLEYVLLPGTIGYEKYKQIKKLKTDKLQSKTDNKIYNRDITIYNNQYLAVAIAEYKLGSINYQKFYFVKATNKEDLKKQADKDVSLYKTNGYQSYELKILCEPISREQSSLDKLKSWISECKTDILKYINSDENLKKEVEEAYKKYSFDAGIRG